jgi:hypothetical protein
LADAARAEAAKAAEAARAAEAEAARAEAAKAAKAEAAKAKAAKAKAAKAAKAEAAKAAKAEAAKAEAAKAEKAVKAPTPVDGRPRAKVVARAWGLPKTAKARPELIRERLPNSGNRASPASTGGERRRGQLSNSGDQARGAARGSKGRMAAVAVAITIPALLAVAAASFDPWAPEGCPGAADRGADCARYGLAGRTYGDLALLNVDRELDKSQWASAKADLQRILLIRPNFAVALEARGEAEAALHDTTAALADYNRVLTLAPDDLATRAKRGELYQSLGKTEQAVADFAFIYHADQSAPGSADVVAFVRRIDHSTVPPKVVHKPLKRRRQPNAEDAPPVDAAPSPVPSPPTEQSGET